MLSVEDLKAFLDTEGIDYTKISETNSKKKGKIVAKLIAVRADLLDAVIEVLRDESRKQMNAARLLNEVKKIKNRILNLASHAGSTPLYTREAEDAIELAQLKTALDEALATLEG